MVRSFGLLLVIGVAIAFALALTAGFAALALRRGLCVLTLRRRLWGRSASGLRRKSPGDHASLTRVARGESENGGAAPPAGLSPRDRPRVPERALSLALSHPRRVLGVGLALAVIGWGVGTQIETVSDIRSLAPQNLGAVEDLNELQDTTGVSGELDVSVEAPDLTDPATVAWMAAFKQRVLRRQRLQRRKPELPRRRRLPGAGALGLPHPRRRQADPRRDRRNAGGAVPVRPAPGRAGRPADRRSRPPGAALVRHPRPVAGGPAGADRPGARGDRRARARPADRPRGSRCSSPGCR